MIVIPIWVSIWESYRLEAIDKIMETEVSVIYRCCIVTLYYPYDLPTFYLCVYIYKYHTMSHIWIGRPASKGKHSLATPTYKLYVSTY